MFTWYGDKNEIKITGRKCEETAALLLTHRESQPREFLGRKKKIMLDLLLKQFDFIPFHLVHIILNSF